MRRMIFLVLIRLLGKPAMADAQSYAGQNHREIKALDQERLEGLLAGAGLGYAKAAELNGWPGPLHVLELANALALDKSQRSEIMAIREAMLAKARPLGKHLVDAEIALEDLFLYDSPDEAAIAEATAKVGMIEAELRAVHLAAHLETKPLLSRHQQMLYTKHRGYDDGPGGHGMH